MITKIPEAAIIPLSTEQKRLWFLQQLNPDNPFYNYSELYRLKGDLNTELLKKSISLIEQKHHILKSNYIVKGGEPCVVFNSEISENFTFKDFSIEAIDNAEKLSQEFIKTEARTVFDLVKDSLFKVLVIKVSTNNYLLLIVMHHIITDKWSMRVFRKDLAAFYSSLLNNESPTVNEPQIQYASYAYWQQQQKTNISHLNYWKEKLKGDLPQLNLPFDRNRKPQPSYQGTFHKQEYSKNLSRIFFDFCKKVDATPYVVMLSIYYILLHKYTQQKDLLIGTPITKRNNESLENLIGFFNDTLVLRTELDLKLNFVELVANVKETTLQAFSNNEISFNTLVKEINPKRTLNVHPFFQVMFLYHKVPETPILDPSIEISYEPYDIGVAKFDLTLYISEDRDNLSSLIEYETDLFDERTISQMHEHFKLILENVITNSQKPLYNLNNLTNKEEVFFNSLENPSIIEAPIYNGIHELIELKSEECPDSVAIIFDTKEITYRELNLRANNVALELMNNGIASNDVVALYCERSPDIIIGLLGILKAGACYLPLDPKYPSDRVNFILKDSESKLLLTDATLEDEFIQFPIKSINLEKSINNIAQNNAIKLPKVNQTDLAYLIYTSGSTGKPKGVAITHENIINSTLGRISYYKGTPKAFLLMSSIAFDSSKAGIFWSLCTGAALVISENRLEQDLDKLTSTVKNYSISHTLMLPSLYNEIINNGNLDNLKSLQTVIVAGEVCTGQLTHNHFRKLPKVNLYNEYGPTEGTIWCTAHKVNKSDIQKNNIPIGKPVAGTKIYILDDQMNRVPYGTSGELYIGGKNLAKEYYNDTSKTEKSFIPNPFKSGEKLYKTGDLVKFNTEGNLLFIGRKDQQVKIRGYRIELDEIEQQIHNNKNVSMAAVVVENKKTISAPTNLEDNKLLTKWLNKQLQPTDLDELITSVENLNDEELDVILKNL